MEDRILTAREVAEYLQLSKSKVYYLLATKQLPHLKIGRSVRVRESDLNLWLKGQAVPERFAQISSRG